METRTCMPLSVLPQPALHRRSDRTATLFTLQGRWALGLYDFPSVPKPGDSGSLHVSSPWCLCRTCLKVTTAPKQVWSRSPTPCPVLQPLWARFSHICYQSQGNREDTPLRPSLTPLSLGPSCLWTKIKAIKDSFWWFYHEMGQSGKHQFLKIVCMNFESKKYKGKPFHL